MHARVSASVTSGSRTRSSIRRAPTFTINPDLPDTTPDDITNATNRAPFPILHLLREDSIESRILAIIEGALASGKPVALVCHAPAVLKNVTRADGKPVVKGRTVTGFTNEEEEAVGLTDVVPFLLEDVLRSRREMCLARCSS